MNFDPIIVDYSSGAHKLLSDNRAAYIAQSAASRFGEVAPFTPCPKPENPNTNVPAAPGKESEQ